MKNKVEVTKQQNCKHHWIINPPDDLMSYGKCKRCGAVSEFYNAYTSDLAYHAKPPDKTPIQPID